MSLATGPFEDSGSSAPLDGERSGKSTSRCQMPVNKYALKLVSGHCGKEVRGTGACLNLKHPNLVTLYDMRISDEGSMWVVMEYVVGDTLAQRLGRYPRGLPRAQVMPWLRQICSGVEHLHRCSIVHRDLKPTNVFIEGDTVKIGDYGLARFIHPGVAASPGVGTYPYMAPEVVSGHYDWEADWYSVGVIACEMLAGHRIMKAFWRDISLYPPSLLLLRQVPSACRDIVKRLLDNDPKKRCPSPAEFLDEFETRLAHVPTEDADQMAGSSAQWEPAAATETWREPSPESSDEVAADSAEKRPNSIESFADPVCPIKEIIAGMILGVLALVGGLSIVGFAIFNVIRRYGDLPLASGLLLDRGGVQSWLAAGALSVGGLIVGVAGGILLFFASDNAFRRIRRKGAVKSRNAPNSD